jgi:hypothetical protein
MPEFLESERLAARLRQQLRAAHSPELKILCGLAFFARLHDLGEPRLEPFLREFVPQLANSAIEAQLSEFFPQDLQLLSQFQNLIAQSGENLIRPSDLSAITTLRDRLKNWLDEISEPLIGIPSPDVTTVSKRADRDNVTTKCLFVEDYPDFGLEPRGRVLTLQVSASPILNKVDEDALVIQCPVEQLRDPFLVQARESVKAARTVLTSRYGLSKKSHYRIDFKIDSPGARFTGDSLGVAFAVGAVSAIARNEILPETVEIANSAAFSGALAADGKLTQINLEGLKLKITRAFYSDLKYLVIPRSHITEAWEYLKKLEAEYPERKLELVGSETLEQVVDDPRLIPRQRVSKSVSVGRKIWRARRSTLVEVILLVILFAVLGRLIAPVLDKVPSKVVSRKDGFEVQNRFSRTLWTIPMLGCDSLAANHDVSWAIADLCPPKGKEVIYAPVATQACSLSGWFYVYDARGNRLFARNGRVCGVYPTDSISADQPDYYEGPWIKIFDVNGERIIICDYSKIYPARGYITLWKSNGDSLGWYMLSGTGSIIEVIDIDNDGTQELLGYAFWNRLACVGFFVIPAHAIHGVSPPYWRASQGFDLTQVVRGNQMRFIALPLSFDVGKICNPGFMQGSAQFTQLTQDEFRLTSHEFAEGSVLYTVDYYVDREFRCKEVKLSDNFRKKRQTLIEERKIKDIPYDTYCDMLRDSVRYWLHPTDSMYTTEGELRAKGR